MKGLNVVALVAALAGCTSVKLVQRDGCWVRRTEQWLGRITEEIGPCALPAPPWVEDRLTRLVQECVARADYRWQSRALSAWGRGEALPEQDEGNLLRQCMSEVSGALITQKETLEARLRDVTADRDALRARTDDDRSHLRASYARIAEYLGEAAKKAAPPATATATASSDGRATTESAATPAGGPIAVVNAVPATAAGVAAPKVQPAQSRTRAGKALRPAGRKDEVRGAVVCSTVQKCDPRKEPAHVEGAAGGQDESTSAATPGADGGAPAGTSRQGTGSGR